MNCLMWQGKKATSQRIFYDAMDQIKKRMPDANPIDVFTQAVENVKPSVEVRSKRVGGATYQVPMQVNRTRQQSLSIRWLINASRGKKGRPMFLRLADELMAAYRREGEAMTEAGSNIVEPVPMPEPIRAAIEVFIAEHHQEQVFEKRKRDRANPESLGRRDPSRRGERP